MGDRTLLVIVGLLAILLIGQGAQGTSQPAVQVTLQPVVTGQTFVASLSLLRTPISGRVRFTTVQRVAIFPFADYSHQQAFVHPLSWGGNRQIIEALTDRFLTQGIAVALQEDVDGLLIAEGFIQRPHQQLTEPPVSPSETFRQRAAVANTPEFELVWGFHDDVMREEVEKVVRGQEYLRGRDLLLQPPGEPIIPGLAHPLARENVIDLGRRLDVDLIIRGRIYAYGVTQAKGTTAVVQVRLYAQETRTGELIWSNRAEAQAVDSADVKVLIDQATGEVSTALMADFFGTPQPAAARQR